MSPPLQHRQQAPASRRPTPVQTGEQAPANGQPTPAQPNEHSSNVDGQQGQTITTEGELFSELPTEIGRYEDLLTDSDLLCDLERQISA